MIILGIDPGKEGGMAWLDGSDSTCFSFKDKSEHEIAREFQKLSCSGAKAFLEHVHSAPMQGVKSTFSFGRGYGFLRGILVALEIPFEDVSPQLWERQMRVPARGKKTRAQHKQTLKRIAQQLYPKNTDVDLTTCDGLLIAHYGAMKIFNTLDI